MSRCLGIHRAYLHSRRLRVALVLRRQSTEIRGAGAQVVPFRQRASAALRASCLRNLLPKYLREFSPPLRPIFWRKSRRQLYLHSGAAHITAVTRRQFVFQPLGRSIVLDDQ